MRKLVVIAGIPIDDLNMEETLARLEDFIASGQPHQVATVNADFIVRAWDDPELRYILQDADLLTADGMPLVWGARLLGAPLEGRVTGADLVPALATFGSQRGWRIYFLGARPGVAAHAAQILTERHPGLQVVGVHSPPLSTIFDMEPGLVERIRQARPDILLVAFGNPKQEKWIHMHLTQLGVPVCIGVGGTFDFIAGEVRRAPAWMQRSGLEWLYRLLQEPRRMWRRYVVDIFQFGRFFIAQWLRQLGGRKFEPLVMKEKPAAPERMVLSLSGALTIASRSHVQAQVEAALNKKAILELDMAQVTFVDSAMLGALVALTRQARLSGGDLALQHLQAPVRRSIELLRLDAFLTLTPSPSHPEGIPDAMEVGQDASRPSQLAQRDGWVIYSMPVRLDLANASAVRAAIEAQLAQDAHLIADFSLTCFLDSSGIAALLGLNRLAEKGGGELRMVNIRKDVFRSLELAGMARYFHVYTDLDSAARPADRGTAPIHLRM